MIGKKKTNEEWLQEAGQFPYSCEYEWLDEYKNAYTKLRYRHSVCGEIREISPSKFLCGQQCICGVKEKKKQTTLKRFGVEYVTQSEQMQEKTKQTMLKKYGVLYSGQSKEKLEKTKQTMLKKYGIEFNSQKNRTTEQIVITDSNEKLKQFILENREKKTNKQMSALLGFADSTIYWRYIDKYDLRSIVPDCSFSSTGENEIAEFIQELGFDIERHNRTILSNNREIDIYVPKKKFAIEYNGTYWHKDKPAGYHESKVEDAKKVGITLLHIWDYEWSDTETRRFFKKLIRLILTT